MSQDPESHLDGRRAALGLALIVAIYLALAVQAVRSVPMFEGYDENFHTEYIYYVHDTNKQPVMPTRLFEGMQPPAYYFLMARLIDPLKLVRPNLNPELAGLGDSSLWRFHHTLASSCHFCEPARTVRLLRLVDVGLGALTIVVAFLVAISLFPRRWALALGATAAAAFLPEFIDIQALINNDALASLLGALFLLGCVRVITARSPKARLVGGVLAGCTLGLGLVTKEYFVALAPLAPLALVLAPTTLRNRVLPAVGFAVSTLLVAGNHLRYNLLVYHALWPFAQEKASIELSYPPGIVHRTVLAVVGNSGYMAQLRHSFWYEGGWSQLVLPQWIYLGLDVLTALVVVGVIVALSRPGILDLDTGQRRALLLGCTATALVFAGVVYSNLQYSQFRGRYFQPVLGLMAPVAIAGIAALLPRRFRTAGYFVLPALLLGLSLFVGLSLNPSSYDSVV